MNKALIFGASGLTGNVLQKLLSLNNYYDEVVCFVRIEIQPLNSKFRIIVSDLSDLKNYSSEFNNADIYCCMGTTIKKVDYDKEKFKKADLYLPTEIARIGGVAGAEQLLIISSLGANIKSKLFYNRVKGELQDNLKNIPLSSIHIFQPSILDGERKNIRLSERMGVVVIKAFSLFISNRYKAIKAEDVVMAMFIIAKKKIPGYHIYKSDNIKKIADGGHS